MAGILSRFKDIMSSNINAVLDKAEDPEKMVDQYLRNMESDLGKVKAETAAVMAEETRRKRELGECKTEIDKMQLYAKKALEAGNEGDARAFLEKKSSLSNELELLTQSYTMAAENSDKMRSMYEKLTKDISTLQARKNEIKIKTKLAKTQTRMSQMGGASGIHGSMSAFDRMEEKANRMLDQANAMRELDESSNKDDIADLMNKYETEPSGGSAVDDELEALKAELDKK